MAHVKGANPIREGRLAAMISEVWNWFSSMHGLNANARGAVITILLTLVLVVVFKILSVLFRRLRKRYLSKIEASDISTKIEVRDPDTASRVKRSIGYVLGLVQINVYLNY